MICYCFYDVASLSTPVPTFAFREEAKGLKKSFGGQIMKKYLVINQSREEEIPEKVVHANCIEF